MGTKKNYRYLVISAIGSFLFHAFIIYLLFPVDNKPHLQKTTQTINLKVIKTDKKPRLAEKPEVEESFSKTSAENKPVKRQTTFRQKPTVYNDFLPLGNFNSEDSVPAAATTKGPSKFRHFDEEGSRFSQEFKNENFSEVEAFAKDLSQRINLPRSFTRLVRSGKSYLRLHRAKDGWQISRVTGNRYLRAALFESIDSLSLSTYSQSLLKKMGYESLRIYLTYNTVSVLDKTIEPLRITTDGNKVFLNITHAAASQYWQLAMPVDNEEGDDLVLPNLIGIGSFIIDTISNNPEPNDPDILRLRNSPAFMRPIGR